MTIVNSSRMSKKIQSLLPAPPRTENDGKVENLTLKSITELKELLDRQQKLLDNKQFMARLPDKGAKLQAFYSKVNKELQLKINEDGTRLLLEKLNINSIDKDSIQDAEWIGKSNSKTPSYLDSDDDSEPEDVLQILSQNTATERIVKVLKAEQPSISAKDLEDIGENLHVKYIVNITETNSPKRMSGQFKPYKTTTSNVHDPQKEMLRKRSKHWENTSATPPPIIHGPVKLLSIDESLKLQREHERHTKEVEARHAAEKLMERSNYKMAEVNRDSSTFGKYREAESDVSEASDAEGSDAEVHDEEPERGGVVFTVMN